jgi:hypothetical protein
MTQTKVEAPFVENNSVRFKNLIINGDMNIAQRATSTTGVSTTGNFILDRWKCNVDNLGAFTISQSTDVPTGQGFSNSMKWDCTTADASPAAGDNLTFQHRFEGQNLQMLKKGTSSAEKTTLSFWVKSNKTGTYVVELTDKDNSSRLISKTYTISSSDTWEKKTITFDGDTTGTLSNDNTTSLDINFWLGSGSSFTSGSLNSTWGAYTTSRAVGQVNLADSTSNEWYITGVQLEVGDQATDFEHLPFEIQEQRCQRYCMVYGNGQNFNAAYYNSSTVVCTVYFPTKMRAAPSVTCTDLSNSIRVYRNNAIDYVDTLGDNGDTVYISELYNSSDASGTAGHAATANVNNGNFQLIYDSEL